MNAPIRVVVCDDVAEMRSILRDVLEEDPGVRVVGEAADGREGLRAVGELKPDVVLIDLGMPEMDGLKAIPLIAALSPRTGIVVFSAFNADRMRHLTLSRGADRYLEKGAPLEDLHAAVREVAEERRAETL